MATVTILLNERYKSADGLFPIIVRVDHLGDRRKIPVGFRIDKKFWKDGRVTGKHPKHILINQAIVAKEDIVRRYLADCQVHGKDIRLDLIGTGRASYSFTDYLRHRSKQYDKAGKVIMRRKVNRFVKEITGCAGREVFFEDIDGDFLRQLEQHLITNGNQENTRHKKFKFLSEFYTHAAKEGKAPLPNPFDSYNITPKPVKKEKLTEAEIGIIENLKLSPGPAADARNIFLFSYYAKGARFENCAVLRRADIRDGRINFRTNKGNKYLSVKIHARLQAILDQYQDGDFVFPYVKEIPEDAEEYINMIGSKNTVVNRNLKVVQSLAEIHTPISMHIARHSFAYHLKKVSGNINVIQDALGHSDQRTTQIYLKSLDDQRLDGEMEKLYGV